MKRFLISLTALAIAAPALAHAEDGLMRVKVGDLNLASDAGASTALRRIGTASTRFCGGGGSEAILQLHAYRQCRQTMMAKAVARLDAPRVTALYQPAPRMMVAKR